jgi:hypothetical protein
MDAPAVAVSADGKTIATAWMDQRRGRQERDVWWRVIRDGRPGPEMALADDAAGIQGHTALAVDARGVVHAVWESEGKIWYRTSERSKEIGSEGGATQPSLATNGERVVVAYEIRGGAAVRVIR